MGVESGHFLFNGTNQAIGKKDAARKDATQNFFLLEKFFCFDPCTHVECEQRRILRLNCLTPRYFYIFSRISP